MNAETVMAQKNDQNNPVLDTATFGSGCFWCSEAIFEMVNGVIEVIPGYSGGEIPNPDYEKVCTGKSGYAEVVQIIYNPETISFENLLEIFWQTHDPTTLNRQGADIGDQYRSVIFYHSERQKILAQHFKNKLNESRIWENPVVTEISPFKKFYKAEGYHQDFYSKNASNSYCNFVITPKIRKFEKVFAEKIKTK